MSEKSALTAEEAFIAEVMEDSDNLLKRIEEIDKTLADKIKKATEEAAGRAFTAARLRYEELIAQSEGKLVQAGHQAAALIGNQLDSKIVAIVSVNSALERKGWKFVILATIASLIIGAVGGFIGSFIH